MTYPLSPADAVPEQLPEVNPDERLMVRKSTHDAALRTIAELKAELAQLRALTIAAVEIWENLIANSKKPATLGDHEVDRRQVILSRSEFDALYTAAEAHARQAERERCREIVVQMKNQRQAYRDIIDDPNAQLPQYQHWAKDIVDRISEYDRGERAGVREGIEMAVQLIEAIKQTIDMDQHNGIKSSTLSEALNLYEESIRALLPGAPKEEIK